MATSEDKSPKSENAWPESEIAAALKLTLLLLLLLAAGKSFLGGGWFASLCYTGLAAFQLYIPVWRAEKNGLGLDAIGLHFHAWRHDLKLVVLWCGVTFPIFAIAYHFFMTQSAAWAATCDLGTLLPYLPKTVFAPKFPETWSDWGIGTLHGLEIVAIHLLGVALPEETFYRGYLQPLLEQKFKPTFRLYGVFLGKGVILTAMLFALGHFLGEWNPLRFGPFFPALAFGWLRNASGSCISAITFHGLCNIFSEFLFNMYNPID